MEIAVEDVGLGGFGVAVFDELFLNKILDFFDGGDVSGRVLLGENLNDSVGNKLCSVAVFTAHRFGRVPNSVGDLGLIKRDNPAVAFFDFFGQAMNFNHRQVFGAVGLMLAVG